MTQNIDLSKPRYDQSTFWGRVRHFRSITDMRTLLATSETIKESQTILKKYKETGEIPDGDVERLWKAKQVVETSLHPDTGETIPRIFRVSAFVPANIVICAGMLSPGIGLTGQLFWQWVNQSYNIGLNFANRNASSQVSTPEIATNYTIAVLSSCGLAFGLTKLANRVTVGRNLVMMFVPFVSVSVAGVLNVFLMRRNELTEGVNIKTPDGTVVGKSQIAGKKALTMVSGVRVANSVPILTVVPIIFSMLQKTTFLQKRPHLLVPTNLVLIVAALYTTLPCAIALFPQEVPMKPEQLEERFQNLTDEKGNKIDTLYFNRGL